jgi:hypothetical protein
MSLMGPNGPARLTAKVGHKQTFKSVTKSEFAILILWVALPPLLVGGALVWKLKQGVLLQLAFLLLSVALAVAFFLFSPGWLGQYLGLHDVEFLGRRMMWSPLGWICVATAGPLTLLLSLRPKRAP